jgi:BirA family biotin operon repressor/biotin-[acetyl-CoA-carboxylase] ligase
MNEFIAETGSTSADLAARLRAADHVPEGYWLVADRQTAGRGRLGREWHDGVGNFMGSTVVHAAYADPPPASLALVAGIALHQVIAALLPAPHCAMLKWPNDVMIGSAKLAGILLERTGDAVVVGIGVNLASAPTLPDRATVALADLTTAPARDAFAKALATQFAVELGRWRAYGLPAVIARWLTLGHPTGTRLRIAEPDGSVLEGSFAGLTDLGLLQLRLADGSLHTVGAGDVRLEQE